MSDSPTVVLFDRDGNAIRSSNTDGYNRLAVEATIIGQPLSINTVGLALDTTLVSLSDKFNSLGQKTMDGSIPVVIASNQIPIIIESQKPSTSVITSIDASNTSITLLASNANRLGATIFNDAMNTVVLYLKLGAVASTTSYTVQIIGGGYYEIPFSYTGIIDGVWNTTSAVARITELSA